MSSKRRYKINACDMSDEMQYMAINVAVEAFEKYNDLCDIAENIRVQFDKLYGPAWHCIVVENADFGSSVKPTKNHYILFALEEFNVMLFK